MPTLEQARSWYPNYDAVHGFGHIKRVYRNCEKIGPLEGADMEILLAAALLHDARGSHPGEGNRNEHHLRSADFAKIILLNEHWADIKIKKVQHCIIAHRYRKENPPQTIEAKVLFDADKLDVIGAIGVVRALAYAYQVKAPAYFAPSNQFLASGEREKGEPHSAYHEYLFKLRKIKTILYTKTAREIAEYRQVYLNGFFQELSDEMNNKK
ncbi:MAG: HD domain-containing protein [Anaerolineaceae bacterium]|nr:HD domain-containing protein [Anaerolineaceae bacterium]